MPYLQIISLVNLVLSDLHSYQCFSPFQKFFQKGNLLKHAVVHNPNAKMILTCDHCSKNFTSRDYLSQHMLEHTQGRIYLCHLCDKGFVKVRPAIQCNLKEREREKRDTSMLHN